MKALLLLVLMLEGFYCYEYCSSYKDIFDDYESGFTCSDYCCGTASNKYCCSDACSSLTRSSECGVASSVVWIPIVAVIGGLVGLVLIISLLGYCCYRCCCATPKNRGAVIVNPQQTTTTSVFMNTPATSSAPPPVNPNYRPEGAYMQPPPYPGKY
ncbi:protein shisa-4-like [Lineus longissimus]|uniref:protein shisa-4-like n=1 Tax=Lineus longissimus TaxID=88925 RepID=UPI002B4C4DA8